VEKNMSVILNGVTTADIETALQASGCSARLVTEPALRIESAAQGLGFLLIPGRPDAADPVRYSDLVFQCVVAHAAPARAEAWNAGRRFARMVQQGGVVVLTLDVLAAGGVTPEWLRAQCELFQLLLGEFSRHLLAPAPVVAATEA
jgi:hypothetical protein